MEYLTIKETAKKWKLGPGMVTKYCLDKRIPGAKKENGRWCIPETAKKPLSLKEIAPLNHEFRFIDLFCGIGGFHQALTSLGGQCVFACDKNALCREVYTANYADDNQEMIIDGDIRNAINVNVIPQFDVLCGGFPCQTFSKAGKGNGFKVVEKENGERDDRGQLFYRIIDILQNHPECRYVILENVRNLADKEDNWSIICEELKGQGFVITETPIIESPHNFGIPQVRERVYILGIREEAIQAEELREKGEITREMLNIERYYRRCPKNCIPMLMDDEVDPKYFVPDELVEVLDIWEEFLQNIKDIKSPFWLHKAGLGIYDDEEYKRDPNIGYADMPDWKKEMVWRSRVMYNNNYAFIDEWQRRYNMTERSLVHQKFEWNASRDCKSIKEGITQFRQSGVRVKNPDYFPSLVAINNTPIVWDKNLNRYRYLSPQEAAKLQSFKKNFIFNDSDATSYRQLGNAVNVLIVKMFAKELLSL